MSGETEPRHFTVRPSFAIGIGLLVISLYFVWAAFGAAPISLNFASGNSEAEKLPMPAQSAEVESATMKGMNMGDGAGGMTPDEFTDITYKFIDDLTLEDGSVRPTMEWTMKSRNESGEMGASTAMTQDSDMAGDTPIDVYVIAQRFSYEPGVLRLKQGTPYRFIMMATDVNHGAAIRAGLAGHIMRRPAKVLTETVMTFTKTGEFMMYCTVYCGIGHDQMRGKIIVE